RLLLPAAAAILLPAMALAQSATPGPGIPLAIAEARARNIRDLRYSLALTLPSDVDRPLQGTNTLSFELVDASAPLVIDFATSAQHILEVTANGADASYSWINGHIVLPAAALRPGKNVVEIAFTAGDASLNRNPDFLYALFVPARAHLAMPCFEEPDLKARWSLTLTVPAAWNAVSNGAEIARTAGTAGGGNGPTTDAVTTITFAETEPLPTYLFSFVA